MGGMKQNNKQYQYMGGRIRKQMDKKITLKK